MNRSQLRVKLVVAAGIIGTSLLAATFTGCQSNPASQMPQGGAYGQYNRGPNGPQTANYASPQQSAFAASSGPDANGFTPQNRQAFLNETQRIGAQPSLTAQDVVAMSRSGMPPQQIAITIQQRGTALRSTPGVAEYLTQYGVNPAVLGAGSPSTSTAGQFAGQASPSTMSAPQQQFGNAGSSVFGSGVATTTAYSPAQAQMAQAQVAQAQKAGFETSPSTSVFDTSASTEESSRPAPAWRPMTR